MRKRRIFRQRRTLTSVSEIDITPLIDLAFSLLIIFMIATPLLEQTIPLNLPQETARPQPPLEKNDYQVISIDAKGKISWGTQPVTRNELLARLNTLAAQPKPPVIHLRGDRSLDYGKVIEVVDTVKTAGLSQISLDTQAL